MKRWGVPSAVSPGLPAPNPDFSNVLLLAGFNGADGSTTITDESSYARGSASIAGDAQIDTAVTKYGSGALLLDGTGDWVSWPDHGDWDISSTVNFQLELWLRWAAGANLSAGYTLMSQYNASADERAYRLRYETDGTLKFDYSADTVNNITAVSAAWSPSTEVFYHVAYSRVGGVSRLFVDGVKLAQSSVSNFDPAGSDAPFRIGAHESGGAGTSLFNGHIDEVRFTKILTGSASTQLYTADFTPPTSAFPRS